MSKKLRIVFMGTPHFALEIVKSIITNNHEVVGVVTVPDKPAGRGQKVQESPVKTFAVEQGLTLLQPTNLKDETFLSELQALNADVFVVVAFRMLPKAVWSMPSKGTFNLHASLLPQYRGAAPINWAIINKEKETGVTTFFIDEHIDTGAMILQESLPITAEETAGSLHDKLMHLGAKVVEDTLHLISEEKVETTIQPQHEELRTAHKIHKDTCHVQWNATVEDIDALIRGMSPYPTAWTNVSQGGNTFNMKIYEATPLREEHSLIPGSILQFKKEVRIAANDGFIILKEIQLPGKRKMNIKDVLNGFEFQSDAKAL
ncbi:methionyl-tRNA formyltransferase [Imtechella halotolerans]|uniref:Methionyl-tRNA formyltransferase n=1 Tax=Imtechella halotolerans K1 TaxID=946077 RepID=I0W8L0_9FLAO|nr:methionyl-tRNA formyltransferase [Imtechella halotolerans]EID72726.1 methionyl-tRNA formyltransferase [Imtechella halotolerans K1]WMQ64648.1 methionyl-tRNA formyltransferase [Imtechella halotolerans]